MVEVIRSNLLVCSFKEICEGSTGMSLHSRDRVFEHKNESRQDCLMEVFLEFFCHIICDLSKSMQSSISYFADWVLEVLKYNWDHGSNLINLINVLSYLRKCHQSSILEPPIFIVLQCGLN